MSKRGKSDPPTSGAPGFGDERISWDPRAPHGKGGGGPSSEPPVIDPIPPFPSENPPPVSGSGSPGCKIRIDVDGSYAGTITVGADGTWTWTPPKPLPPGEHCISAQQTCPGLPPSEKVTQCFTITETVPPADQTVDLTSQMVSWMGDRRGPVPGVMAVRIDGQWVYGVLRKLEEVRA